MDQKEVSKSVFLEDVDIFYVSLMVTTYGIFCLLSLFILLCSVGVQVLVAYVRGVQPFFAGGPVSYFLKILQAN